MDSINSYMACKFPVLPLRSEPSEASEMVSQILYGEEAEVLETKEGWLKIRLLFDGYQGWVNSKGMGVVEGSCHKRVVSEWAYRLEMDGQTLMLPAGAELDIASEEPKAIASADKIIATARLFLGIPYLWGGRCSFGFDCSGFVQTVFKINGIKLPRDSKDQSTLGTHVHLFNEIKPADLAFFSADGEKVTHVGILIDSQTIIHSSGFVRIDSFDHQGIFNKSIKEYTHNLFTIKRVL